MKLKPTKRINGVSYDYHSQFGNREDAVKAKQSLVDQGHKVKFSKDRKGIYQVYVIFNKESSPQVAAVQPDLTKTPNNFPIETICGVDFYKHSLHLDWKDPTLLNTLYDFKDDINNENSNNDPDPKPHVIQLDDGTEFIVQPKAARKYTLVLESAGMKILFSRHKADAQFPNCRIEIGSMCCWHPGWLYLYEQITAWLKGHGAEIVKQKVSEFHITADLLNLDYNFTGFVDVNRWQARANRFQPPR